MVRRSASPLGLLIFSIACSEYDLVANDPDNLPADTTTTPASITETTYDTPEAGESGSITGRVCDLSGEGWVVGADVYIELDDGSRIETTTDADGYYTLEGVPYGDHIIYIKKGSFSATIEVSLAESALELTEEECIQQEEATIAVVTGDYDHIESILDTMGLEYDLYRGTTSAGGGGGGGSPNEYLDLLEDPDLLAEYDIIFLNCGINDSWESRSNSIANNLRTFVANGGSLYSSDWAYYFFEVSFPDAIDFYGQDTQSGAAYIGAAGTLEADVLDANMVAVLGASTARLNYDLDIWAVPETASAETDVLLRGNANTWDIFNPSVNNAPLAVRYKNNGTAIYTTFHNEQQITIDMTQLLQEIVLSL